MVGIVHFSYVVRYLMLLLLTVFEASVHFVEFGLDRSLGSMQPPSMLSHLLVTEQIRLEMPSGGSV